MCLELLGELPEARRELEAAARHLLDAVRRDRTKPIYLSNFLECTSHLGNVLVRLGEHQALAEAARGWRRELGPDGGAHLSAALALARCVPVARADPRLPEPQRNKLADGYAAEAVAALRDWVQKAYDERKIVFDPSLLTQLNDLAPLRSLDEYKQFVAEREKKFRGSPQKPPPKTP
jgi:hypothetical protein